jgi:hypothetical protein
MSHSLNPFNRGQRHDISELLLSGKTREEIFRVIYPLVIRQEAPFIFSDNVSGTRIPKPIYDQIPLAFYAIGRVRDELLKAEPNAESQMASENYSASQNYENKRWRAQLFSAVKAEYERGELNGEPNSDPVVIEPVYEPTKSDIRLKLESLYFQLNKLRKFCAEKKVGNREFDYISTRAFVHGKAAILAGIEVDDFLVSIGSAWSPETRREAGIKEAVNYDRYPSPEGMPKVTGFILLLIKAKIPVYLYGPTGSGKSFLAKRIADFLAMEYGEIPLSCGVSRTDLFGNWNAKGFVDRPLIKLYQNGGIFCFEEIDAADPNILLSVNNAVANDELFNTSNGEELDRHPDFIPMATANTLGNGATANFAAREGLDGSTIDRFKYGRVFCDYDSEIEREIMFGDISELEAEMVSASQ